MATFYGSDTACVSDVGLFDVQVTDPILLIGQRIMRRLQTPRGALAFVGDDPNGGWDVRQYVNKKMRPGEIVAAQAQIQNEVQKDEEVQSATVILIPANGNLTIQINGMSSAGPFNLTMNVGALTTQVVFNF